MDNIISIEKSKKKIDLKKYKINKEIKKKDKMDALVNTLRIIALDKHLKEKSVIIPDDCEQYGFTKGDHNLGKLLYFIADMLEE
jgi:hypothetical protein